MRAAIEQGAAEPWALTAALRARPEPCQWSGRIFFRDEPDDERARTAMVTAFRMYVILEYKRRHEIPLDTADAEFLVWATNGSD